MVKKAKANLPGDIIDANILTRLPVKTLIRFTTVCKSWYSLFSGPYFINTHHQIQKNKITDLLLIDDKHENRIVAVKDRFSPEQLSPSFINYSTIDFPMANVDLVGCCDGIVCVLSSSFNIFCPTGYSSQKYITLWNPALRIKKIVDIYDISALSFGFCYHKQTNDYKVIKFERDLKHVEIYSLISDSWREIDPLGANHLLTGGKYIVEWFGVCYPSGAYCWLAGSERDRSFHRDSVISFDIEDEVFEEMMLPSSMTTNYDGEKTLFIYKDSLAVLHTHDYYSSEPGCAICYIWVMKEYNNPKSWTMIHKFDSPYLMVSFVGVIETDLMVLSAVFRDDNMMIREKAIVVDIGKSQVSSVKDVDFLIKARWVSYFTETLALLKKVHRRKSPCN